MARIAIDPELWRKVRVRAFEEGTTGAAIVNEALEAFLATRHSGRDAIAEAKRKHPKADPPVSSDAAPRSARPPVVEVQGVIEESHMDGDVRVIDKMRVTEASVVGGDFTLEHAADGQQIITPHDKEDPWADLPKPKMIATPEEAAKAAAEHPAIRPVPKPTSKTSRTKSRSGRSTGRAEP